MKLLCDQMLGSLMTWLRILGYDTLYAQQNTSDDALLTLAKTEERTLITRDKELLHRAKKQRIPCIELHSTNLNDQLRTVFMQLPFDNTQLLTRCTLCNKRLEPIEKHNVKNLVPKRIYDQHTTFWYCTTCTKVYWMGTHYDNMMKKYQELTKTN